MDERLQREKRLQRQYRRDLADLHQRAAEFGATLQRTLIRGPCRPRGKQAYELILATGGKAGYTTQLPRLRCPLGLCGLYRPSTFLTIPEELLHMVFAYVFKVPVFCSLDLFLEWTQEYHIQAQNPDYVIHRFVPDEEGNIIPELLVAADAHPGEEDKDIWEDWPETELPILSQIFPTLGPRFAAFVQNFPNIIQNLPNLGQRPSIKHRNKHRMRQIQMRNPHPINVQAKKLLFTWPEKAEDIRYCMDKALSRFHKNKWGFAEAEYGGKIVSMWDLDD